MDTASMIEMYSERYVKPSTPTPPSLRCHKLCLNSQFEAGYIPLIFFYPNHPHHHLLQEATTAEKTTRVLEMALSKTLSYYYPFAGRLRDNMYIDCNDMGAYLSEARLKFPMSELEKRKKSPMKGLGLPPSVASAEYLNKDPSLLLIQFSYFECGGMAICICMSHKLGDIATLFTFYRDWASNVIDQTKHIPTPHFFGPSLFPPLRDPNLVKELKLKAIFNPLTHLLFRSTKLEELKNKLVASASLGAVEKPTRVEVVTALVYKCALDASKKVSGKFRPAGMLFTINLRPITVPPLPTDSVGNLTVGLIIPTPKEEDITLERLVSKIRDTKVKVKDAYRMGKENGTDPSLGLVMDQMNMTASGELDLYMCMSWCRYPFYAVDFGRGKPTMVYFPDQAGGKNMFVLRDRRDGDGIEVLASLEVEEMAEFITNQELLAFASIE